MEFKGKNVLLFGLGLLGGGVATANWLIKQGAKLTITDLKTREGLASSLKQIQGTYKLTLGKHDKANIDDADIVVLNPGVPANLPLLKKAKVLVNEATIFYSNFGGKIIGVTGTRGKTTTSNWTAHLMGGKHRVVLAGNSPERPFLNQKSNLKNQKWAVTEMSSFSSELFEHFDRKPDITVITNIYQDHFNRYPSYRAYVKTKANLLLNQTREQYLVLNYDNSWTPYLLTIPHQSREWFFTVGKLPHTLNGLIHHSGRVIYQYDGTQKAVLDLRGFIARWGMHNVENFLAAALAAHCAGIEWANIQARIKTLPQISMRQETIYQDKKLTVINDTTATSPEGTIAAVERFGSPTTILITGGTDRKLSYVKWGKIIPNYIVPDNVIMLAGSATKKMRRHIEGEVYDTLEECVEAAMRKAKQFRKATILFSPASKSFEKFTNEYDRGSQFNTLVKKALKK